MVGSIRLLHLNLLITYTHTHVSHIPNTHRYVHMHVNHTRTQANSWEPCKGHILRTSRFCWLRHIVVLAPIRTWLCGRQGGLPTNPAPIRTWLCGRQGGLPANPAPIRTWLCCSQRHYIHPLLFNKKHWFTVQCWSGTPPGIWTWKPLSPL